MAETEDALGQAATAIRLLDELVKEQKQQERKRQLLRSHLQRTFKESFSRKQISPRRDLPEDEVETAGKPLQCSSPLETSGSLKNKEDNKDVIRQSHLELLASARSFRSESCSTTDTAPLKLSALSGEKSTSNSEFFQRSIGAQSCLSDYLNKTSSKRMRPRPGRLQNSFLVSVERVNEPHEPSQHMQRTMQLPSDRKGEVANRRSSYQLKHSNKGEMHRILSDWNRRVQEASTSSVPRGDNHSPPRVVSILKLRQEKNSKTERPKTVSEQLKVREMPDWVRSRVQKVKNHL